MIRNLILGRGCPGSADLWRVRVRAGSWGRSGVPGGPGRAPQSPGHRARCGRGSGWKCAWWPETAGLIRGACVFLPFLTPGGWALCPHGSGRRRGVTGHGGHRCALALPAPGLGLRALGSEMKWLRVPVAPWTPALPPPRLL